VRIRFGETFFFRTSKNCFYVCANAGEEAVLELVNDNFPIWILSSKQGDMA
jgi:hypothetical protein